MSLTSFVFDNSGWHEADLIRITLPNGNKITATNHHSNLVTGTSNLIPDSDGTGGTWAGDSTLVFSTTGGAVAGGKWVYTGTGAASAFRARVSQTFDVVAGETYTISGYIDATNVTVDSGSSGQPVIGIYSPDLSTPYRSVSQPKGSNGRISGTFVVPAGVRKVVAIVDTDNCVVATGQTLTFSNPQLEPGNKLNAYLSTPATGGATTGDTFYAMKYGKWERGAITFDINQSANSEIDLVFSADPTILLPGTTTPLLQVTKLLSRSLIEVSVATLDITAPTTIIGTVPVFTGRVGFVASAGSTAVTFKCADEIYLLMQQWPRRVICAGCPFAVFDKDCALSAASFQQNNTVVGGTTTNLTLNSALSAVGNDPLPFPKGYVIPTSGQAAGWAITITGQADPTHITLNPFPLSIAIGDSLSLFPGCDQQANTCQFKYGNLANYGGFLSVPGPPGALSASGA